ncbi:MAG: hypothetical protein WDN30_05455 [Pararobbsia sp.]
MPAPLSAPDTTTNLANSDRLAQGLALLGLEPHRALLTQGLHGIEKESLRVTRDGALALTPHPAALGSALTHPLLTTDYSEALLEFITPTDHDVARTARYAAPFRLLGHRRRNALNQSMPCRLPSEEQIPIANFGTSNIGRLKHVYRQGLAVRYGKTMQCIAGIHFNWSLHEDIWRLLRAMEAPGARFDSAQDSSRRLTSH